MHVLYTIQTMFFQQLVLEWSSILNLYNMCCGIKDSNFIILEDSTINFFHGCRNYYLIKTNIDVMILFKFDIKYVKLSFKAIVSMKFSFDLNLILMWSRNYVLFKWNVKKWLPEKFEKTQFHKFDQSRITFDQSNVLFWLVKCSFSINQMAIKNQSSQPETLWWISSIFRPIENSLRSIE